MANSINLSRKTLIFAKLEQTYNTEVTPTTTATASSNAMVLYDETNPVQIDTKVVDRQVIRGSYSKNSNLKGRQLYMIQPKTMLMGSPGVFYNPTTQTYDGHTGETPPGSGIKVSFLDVLFRSCGMQATISGSSSLSIVYTPRSGSFESATIWTYMDGILHKAYGCVGNMTFEGRAGEGIDVSLDLKGNISSGSPTFPGSNPSPTYPLDRKIMAESYGMTISDFTIGSTSPIVRSFRFDPGNQIIERADLNSAKGLYGLYIVDRQPKLDVTVEVDASSSWNPFTNLTSSSNLVSMALTHGGSANAERWRFSFPSLQTRDVKMADDQGVRIYNISYDVVSATDDADWMITQY